MGLKPDEAKKKASVFFEVQTEYKGKGKLELKNFEFNPPNDTWLSFVKPKTLVTVTLQESGQNVNVSLKCQTVSGAQQVKQVGKVKMSFAPAATPAARGSNLKMGTRGQ